MRDIGKSEGLACRIKSDAAAVGRSRIPGIRPVRNFQREVFGGAVSAVFNRNGNRRTVAIGNGARRRADDIDRKLRLQNFQRRRSGGPGVVLTGPTGGNRVYQLISGAFIHFRRYLIYCRFARVDRTRLPCHRTAGGQERRGVIAAGAGNGNERKIAAQRKIHRRAVPDQISVADVFDDQGPIDGVSDSGVGHGISTGIQEGEQKEGVPFFHLAGNRGSAAGGDDGLHLLAGSGIAFRRHFKRKIEETVRRHGYAGPRQGSAGLIPRSPARNRRLNGKRFGQIFDHQLGARHVRRIGVGHPDGPTPDFLGHQNLGGLRFP